VLLVLGGTMVFRADLVERAFGFPDLPREVGYLIAIHGCAMLSLAFGYFFAALNPNRSVAWVQMGLVRAALEAVVGIVFLASGVVAARQAVPGIAVAAVVAAGYAILYPSSPLRAKPVDADSIAEA
jgi:hypothetical protein